MYLLLLRSIIVNITVFFSQHIMYFAGMPIMYESVQEQFLLQLEVARMRGDMP